MTPDFNQDHFSLFGLPRQFALDMARLDQAYRRVQGEVHPDRFAGGSDVEKRLSMQWATRTNEAYQTLRKPVARARYLLALAGVDTQEETNTAMPADFLMQQMMWRETVAEARVAKDIGQLDALLHSLRQSERELQRELADALDGTARNHAQAALLVRKLRFIEKLADEIGAAQEALEHH
ncbi:MAG: Fe-S protein assembly co-chaperone HscB [Burkholderiales bacterium]|nr:Fe-S protein assembly co-chaperone HscB [Burkholderiales bacterium]